MKTIYKCSLKVEDKQVLKLAFGSKILSTAFQGETLCVWALVDKDEDTLVDYTFYIYGTGHDIVDYSGSFIGTAFIDSLVFHVFAQTI
jgi:hypothetical protein